jgi:hypothetical protein
MRGDAEATPRRERVRAMSLDEESIVIMGLKAKVKG